MSNEYKTHVDALVLAESLYARKKDSYDNKRALKDMRIYNRNVIIFDVELLQHVEHMYLYFSFSISI